MDLIPGINTTAGALHAERLRMEVIAQNIANAHTTRTAQGTPYQRQVVAFESVLDRASGVASAPGGVLTQSVGVRGVYGDVSPFKHLYNPGHPDADERGMVAMPNVDLSMEMVDMIAASRSYEANLAVMKTSRQLAKQAMAIQF
jgi:flagellar basal-body rod protein FlgC